MRPEYMRVYPDAELPLLFAHRGYSKRAPENTLAAFAEARAAGIPGIELDIHRCRTGELVVIHDSELTRVTGRDSVVEDLPLGEIRRLDAGAWFGSAFAGERIPLLSEVFDLLGDSVYYDVEIKSQLGEPEPIAADLAGLIRARRLVHRCMISSFNPLAVRASRRSAPEIPTAVIYSNDREVPFFLRHGEGRFISSCQVLKPDYRKVTAFGMFVNQRILGYPVIAWTVDDPEAARIAIARGATGLISNDPANLLSLTRG